MGSSAWTKKWQGIDKSVTKSPSGDRRSLNETPVEALSFANGFRHHDPCQLRPSPTASEKKSIVVTYSLLGSPVKVSVSGIPAEKRRLVTGQESLGYFAHAYEFELVGAVEITTHALLADGSFFTSFQSLADTISRSLQG